MNGEIDDYQTLNRMQALDGIRIQDNYYQTSKYSISNRELKKHIKESFTPEVCEKLRALYFPFMIDHEIKEEAFKRLQYSGEFENGRDDMIYMMIYGEIPEMMARII